MDICAQCPSNGALHIRGKCRCGCPFVCFGIVNWLGVVSRHSGLKHDNWCDLCLWKLHFFAFRAKRHGQYDSHVFWPLDFSDKPNLLNFFFYLCVVYKRFKSHSTFCATCYKAELRHGLGKKSIASVTQSSLVLFYFSSAFHLVSRLVLLCIYRANLMLAILNFVILKLFPWSDMSANMSGTWILGALQLWAKMASSWRLVILATSLESLLLEPGSHDSCIAEVRVCTSSVVSGRGLICVRSLLQRSWVGVWTVGSHLMALQK